jgi:hypothetical protein
MNKVKYRDIDVVAASVMITDSYGYVPKNKADVNNPSTASRVQQFLLSLDTEESNEQLQAFYPEAIELIEWAKEGNIRGNFGYTVVEILSKGAMTLPQTSFVVGLKQQKQLTEKREDDKAELSKETANSEWFGNVGKRDKFFVKMTSKKYLDNYQSYIYNVITREGNLGSFFSQKDFDLKENDCFIMKATPKKHVISNFHGGKETMFNRVVIEEVVGTKEK